MSLVVLLMSGLHWALGPGHAIFSIMDSIVTLVLSGVFALLALMICVLLLCCIVDRIVTQTPSLRQARAKGEELEDRLRSARATGIMSKFPKEERQARLVEIARRVRNERRMREAGLES